MRFRFAPSPTGNLHIGSARTALFNWVLARHYQGNFILRIEDTDQERSNAAFEANILSGLRWLNLNWDEGPDKGGDCAPYRQSERHAQGIYGQATQTLLEAGRAYRCFCTSKELEAERKEDELNKRPPGYKGRCALLSQAVIEQNLREKKPHTIRFKMMPGQLVINDLIRGAVHFETELISDFVILKGDGWPTFHLAVVLDDALMGITHVVRGEDHLPNTPKQMQLCQALGYALPHYAHLPMILGPDRSKLSKRHGATAVDEYREAGFLPETLVNFMSLLGWSHPEEKEILDVQEVIENISFERIKKAGAIFDVQKCRWMNHQYMIHQEPLRLLDRVRPHIGDRRFEQLQPDQQLHLLKLLSEGAHTLQDFNHGWIWAVEAPVLDATKIPVLPDQAARILASAHARFAAADTKTFASHELTHRLLDEINTGLDLGKGSGKSKGLVMKMLRYRITGELQGPALADVILILGRDESLKRISV